MTVTPGERALDIRRGDVELHVDFAAKTAELSR
jgi:hypothetical protein